MFQLPTRGCSRGAGNINNNNNTNEHEAMKCLGGDFLASGYRKYNINWCW